MQVEADLGFWKQFNSAVKHYSGWFESGLEHGYSYSYAEITCNLLDFVFLSNQGFVLLRFVLNPPTTTHEVRLVAKSKSKTQIQSATTHPDYDPS